MKLHSSDVLSQGMREYGDGTQTVRQTTLGKLITFDPKFRTQVNLSVHERHRFNKRNVSNVHLKDLSKLKLYRPFPSRFQELRHEI